MITPRLRRIAQNHTLRGVVFVTILILGLLYIFVVDRAEAPLEDTDVLNASSGLVLQASEPTILEIPKIKLETTFAAPIGLNPDNTAEVPDSYTQVGWYKHGPTPGELGPAVILGHVDSYQGPAVFFSLGQLEEGDDIYVTREDGSKAHFMVTRLQRNSQSDFPTADVYGDIDHAGLRLITCSGTYDRGVQRYSHNLIVYAELVE